MALSFSRGVPLLGVLMRSLLVFLHIRYENELTLMEAFKRIDLAGNAIYVLTIVFLSTQLTKKKRARQDSELQFQSKQIVSLSVVTVQ